MSLCRFISASALVHTTILLSYSNLQQPALELTQGVSAAKQLHVSVAHKVPPPPAPLQEPPPEKKGKKPKPVEKKTPPKPVVKKTPPTPEPPKPQPKELVKAPVEKKETEELRHTELKQAAQWITPAEYKRNKPPEYPSRARRRHQEGRVLLRVAIDAEGRPQHVQVQRSSGYELLDQAALTAVRRWEFTPASRGMQAVAIEVLVPIDFRLRG